MQGSRGEEDRDAMDARFEGRGRQGCDGCKVRGERKTGMRLMQGSRGEEDSGCDGCKVRGERKTADAMDARFEGRGR